MGVWRGACVAVLFGIVLFVLIPVYVPRPSFIPGFAPPPDMWPRTVSGIGLALGLLLVALSFSKRAEAIADPESASVLRGEAPKATLLLRFAFAVAAFVLYALLVPFLGFLLTSILMLLLMLAMTGYARARLPVSLALAIGLPVALFFFFSSALHTRFPVGSLLRALGF